METDWEALYQANDTRWDKGEPSPGLVDFLNDHPDLERGRVLVPGCGAGHDVREWARHGFDVTGLDVAPGALKRCEQHPQPTGARYRLEDFLRSDPEQPYDMVFEHTFYCAIPVSARADYLRALKRWLRPGGQFIAVHYFIDTEEGPPHGTDREEVLARFLEDFELFDDWVPRSYPNRTELERMFWWRRKAV